jgi:CBS domain-containing protein
MNKTARELVSGQQVEWVRPDDLVDQAFQKMAKHDLTALPVVEPSTGTSSLHPTRSPAALGGPHWCPWLSRNRAGRH